MNQNNQPVVKLPKAGRESLSQSQALTKLSNQLNKKYKENHK